MGIFSRKKEYCPLCGNEIKLLHMLPVKDGTICEDCEKMVRGQFDIEEYLKRRWGTSGYHFEDYKLAQSDPLQAMTIQEISEMIQEKKAQQEEVTSQLGDTYEDMARVEDCFTIAPKALQVGLKRAKELKNKVVATSFVMAGTIARGDRVVLLNNGQETKVDVLDVIECSNSSTFDTELAANMGKHKASMNVSAWIILDITSPLPKGTIICKK